MLDIEIAFLSLEMEVTFLDAVVLPPDAFDTVNFELSTTAVLSDAVTEPPVAVEEVADLETIFVDCLFVTEDPFGMEAVLPTFPLVLAASFTSSPTVDLSPSTAPGAFVDSFPSLIPFPLDAFSAADSTVILPNLQVVQGWFRQKSVCYEYDKAEVYNYGSKSTLKYSSDEEDPISQMVLARLAFSMFPINV